MPVLNFVNQCIFDNGAINKLQNALNSLAIKSPIIVTDSGIKTAGILDIVLSCAPSNAVVYDKTNPNPNEAQVIEVATIYKNQECDGFIALGGGSAIDLAKAAAILVTHEGELASFGIAQKGGRKIGPIAPIIAIPTTAGTGSEVSVGALIILETGIKELLVSPNLIPKIAICDPELTIGLPIALTAATGMDALTHCIEAVLSPTINPPAEAIGLDGIDRIVAQSHLKAAVTNGTNIDARWNMMMASTEGALAFVKGLGAAHALAHACASVANLSPHHGTLNAIFLPLCLEIIEARAEGLVTAKLSRIKRAMNIQQSEKLYIAIANLNREIGIVQNLSMMGFVSQHCEKIVKTAMHDAAHHSNCILFDENDYRQIYQKAL